MSFSSLRLLLRFKISEIKLKIFVMKSENNHINIPVYIQSHLYILGAATDGCRSRPCLACPPLHGHETAAARKHLLRFSVTVIPVIL